MHTTMTIGNIKLSAADLTKRSLKLCSMLLCVLLLAACASQPKEKSFVRPGEFNPQEAAKTRVSLGLTYLKNGNFSQAKFNLDKALEFAPRSGEANYAMAFYYQQVDEVERAEEYYQTAISYSRNDPDVLNSYGAFLCKQGNYGKAKEFFLKAVDSKSYISTAETYENLAICAQSQDKRTEAIAYFDSALNHQPTRASSLFYLTELYIQTEQWEEAKKSLWKYERNAQVNAESLWMSYQIAQGQNNLKTATEYADLLRSMYPDHKHTQVALAQLGKFRPSMAVTQKRRPQQTEQDISALPAVASEDMQAVVKPTPPQQQVVVSASAVKQELAAPQVVPSEQAIVERAVSEQDIAEEVASEQQEILEQSIPEQPIPEQPIPEQTVAQVQSLRVESDSSAQTPDKSTTDTNNVEVVSAPVETIVNTPNTPNEQATLVSQTDVEAYQEILEKMKQASELKENLAATEVEDLSQDAQGVSEANGSVVLDANVAEGYHIVLPKENLYRISLKYNVKMKKLLEWNNLTDAGAIRIGTKLRVRDPIINE
jgi:type IV pilus assembly protein PilF